MSSELVPLLQTIETDAYTPRTIADKHPVKC